MVAIVIGAHGNFAKELVKSGEMICGRQENIGYVTFKTGESAEGLVGKYEEVLDKLDCKDGVLFMVDMFGGSPYNAASRIAISNDNMDIITGVNLPMYLEISQTMGSSTIEELVNTALSTAIDTIKSFKKVMENIEVEEL